MSHFSTIKTKLKNKPILQEALELLQYDVKEDQELKVTGAHGINHETVEAEVAIAQDIGFRMNPMTGSYELEETEETGIGDISNDNAGTSKHHLFDK